MSKDKSLPEKVEDWCIQECPICGRENYMVVRGQVEISKDDFQTYPDIGYSFCNCHNIFYCNHFCSDNPIEVLKNKCDSVDSGTMISVTVADSFFINWDNIYEFKLWIPKALPVIWDVDSLCEAVQKLGFEVCFRRRNLSESELVPQTTTLILKKGFNLVKSKQSMLGIKMPTVQEIGKINYDEIFKLATSVEQGVMMSGRAGIEHYRLMAWIGYQLNDGRISEIGTMHGCSLAAFALNPSNQVFSYDICEYQQIMKLQPNAFRLLVHEGYMDDVCKSDIIHYDAAHEGKEEQEFYEELIRRDWKGVLFLDDIYLNKPMNDFWNGITHRKEDWTSVGHDCGTGVVFFD